MHWKLLPAFLPVCCIDFCKTFLIWVQPTSCVINTYIKMVKPFNPCKQ
jgi:hypothetical protein